MLWAVFSFAVLVHLTQIEDGRLEEEFRNDTPSTEDVHRPVDTAVARLFSGNAESLGSQVTGSSSRNVEEEREISRVVLW